MKRPGRILLISLASLVLLFSLSIAYKLTRENPDEIFRRNSDLRIEVLNGCGVERLAVRVTDVLREQGFNVVSIGSTRCDSFPESVVIDRVSDTMEKARYMARRIGCRNVGKDIDPALYVDVTLIVGRDYLKLFPDVEKKF